MSRARDDRTPPMAEPGRRAAGASTGGISRNADGGLADALQRSAERGDDDATGGAATGEARSGGASATPRPREQPIAPRSRRADVARTPARDRGDAEPPDEGPLESLGRAIAEPLSGADDPGVPGDGAGRKR